MQWKQRGAVRWLEFELFQGIPGLVHGVFLRHGGVSKPPFASLNIGGGTGDSQEAIRANRKHIQEIFDFRELISSKQVHGREIKDVACIGLEGESDEECDGLLIDASRPGIGLLIKHADCQAAIFYDPLNRVVANVHAGWKGNVQNIYAATVEKMRKEWGSRPETLLVGIGPSLGPQWAEFKHYKTELPESFWAFQVRPFYFDLWAISRQQLLDAGILPEHIEIAGICTYADAENFFSYRRDKPTTGRNGTVVGFNSY